MIRPLRQTHRHTVTVLAFALPIVFALGLALRKPAPSLDENSSGRRAAPLAGEDLLWLRRDLFRSAPLEVCLLRERASGRLSARVAVRGRFLKPDVLVYWAPGNPPLDGKVPQNAVLLGSLYSPKPWLAAESAAGMGVFMLYSLAGHEIVEVSKPVLLAAGANEGPRQL